MKTSELIGPALDWAVAKCEGFPECLVFGRGSVKDSGFSTPSKRGGVIQMLLRHIHDKWVKQCDSYPWAHDQVVWQPSTDWARGGPIIERERITVVSAYDEIKDGWLAESYDSKVKVVGPTPLIAAMRCFVASKLGDEVEVPKELK